MTDEVAAGRVRLPDRRESRRERITFADPDTGIATKLYVDVGFMPGPLWEGGGRALEVFLRSGNVHSERDRMLDDAAVMISLLFQHGYRPATLRRHLGRHEDGPARTLIVAALDAVETIERDFIAAKRAAEGPPPERVTEQQPRGEIMIERRLCKDCVHYLPALPPQMMGVSRPLALCGHPDHGSLVDGEAQWPCDSLRRPDAPCGPAGVLFAKKNGAV